MALTELACRHAKPQDRPYKLADSEGLHLLVQINGSRLWRMAYRFDGKQKQLSFGAYPVVTLTEARDRRHAAKKHLEAGVDPAEAKKVALSQRAGLPTFRRMCEEWLGTKTHVWSPGHLLRIRNRLVEDVYPDIGDMPLVEIKSTHILAVLRKVETRGALDIAKRIRQSISQVFRLAIAEGVVEIDPAAYLGNALKPKPRTKHRAALKERELPEFLIKLSAYDGDAMTRLALELVMTTFVRTGEVRYAQWSEFEGLRGPNPTWRIPAERMKMHREHLVPLTPRALRILDAADQLAKSLGVQSEFVFPGKSRDGALSANTMIYALYRMGYHQRATVHGFRGLASTVLNENGFNSDWVELQLAHVEDDQVRAAYNSAQWLKERTVMMAWWSAYLDKKSAIASLLS